MSNLDDFFKKRDKKKKVASKSKFSTIDTDEFAKQLEASTIRGVEEDGELDQDEGGEVINTKASANGEPLDDDWKPFDSEDNKDYSGLRIKMENLKEDDDDYEFRDGADENGKKPLCPWGSSKGPRNDADAEDIPYVSPKGVTVNVVEETKTVERAASPVERPSTPAAAETTAKPAEAPTTGAYVPPSMRNRAAAAVAPELVVSKPVVEAVAAAPASGAYVPPSMRNRASAAGGSLASEGSYHIPTSSVNFRRPTGGSKAQPNINDTMDFPTLGGGTETTDKPSHLANGSNEKFDLIKKGGRVEPKSGDNSINLVNKFTMLSADNN